MAKSDGGKSAYFEPVKGTCSSCLKSTDLVNVVPVGDGDTWESGLCGVCLTGTGEFANLAYWPTIDDPMEGY